LFIIAAGRHVIKVKLRYFQRGVAQPRLNLANVDAAVKPARSGGLTQVVQVVLHAHRPSFAGNVGQLPQVVFPVHHFRLARPAVQTSALCHGFELAEEVRLRFPALGLEYPTPRPAKL